MILPVDGPAGLVASIDEAGSYADGYVAANANLTLLTLL